MVRSHTWGRCAAPIAASCEATAHRRARKQVASACVAEPTGIENVRTLMSVLFSNRCELKRGMKSAALTVLPPCRRRLVHVSMHVVRRASRRRAGKCLIMKEGDVRKGQLPRSSQAGPLP